MEREHYICINKNKWNEIIESSTFIIKIIALIVKMKVES